MIRENYISDDNNGVQVVAAASITWLGWFISGEVGIFPETWIPTSMDGFELVL